MHAAARADAEVRCTRRGPTTAAHPITAETATYFRDVADHLQRVSEVIDNLDVLLSTAFDAHLARISVQQNEDMRKISAGAALVVVPTLIAGVYGMNFDHMPELHWTYGYPFAIAPDGRASAAGLFALLQEVRVAVTRTATAPDCLAGGVVVRLRQPGRRHGLRGRPLGLRPGARRPRCVRASSSGS